MMLSHDGAMLNMYLNCSVLSGYSLLSAYSSPILSPYELN
jgi:hypothetical protein